MVKISVVTVCFNSAKTIERTIKSVLNQSYKNVEYIIIDGGSTDGTLDIIRKYESRIYYWVSEPDKGIYDAMNKGMQRAAGDLIEFLNSDDWFEDGALQKVADAWNRERADVYFGDYYFVFADGTCEHKHVLKDDYEKLPYEMKLNHQATFIRREVALKHPFNLGYRIAADYDQLQKLYYEKASFAYIEGTPLACFMKDGGITDSQVNRTRIEDLRVIRKNAKMHKNESPEIHAIQWHLLQLIVVSLWENRVCQGIKKHVNGKPFVLFGAGEVGRGVIGFLRTHGANVIAVLDNDKNKNGMLLGNVRITHPSFYQRKYGEIVLITNYRYQNEIRTQLMERGLVDGKDFYSYEMWVKWLVRMIFWGI